MDLTDSYPPSPSRLTTIAFREKPSLEANPQPRQRRWAPKSKSGCLTCRKRRVKCDETRPTCKCCIAMKLTCQGYDTVSHGAAPRRPHPILHEPSQIISPPGTSPTWFEIQMFDLLRKNTIKQISGLFDQEFWAVDMLRATRAYPAIWHASLALAAAHQRMTIESEEPINLAEIQKYNIFTIQQANHSIKHLTRVMQRGRLSYFDQEMLLMTSLLFIGISNASDDIAQSLTHWKNGIELYYQLRFWEKADITAVSPRGILSFQSLVSMFFFFDGQSADHGDFTQWIDRPYRLVLPKVDSFHSLAEANLHLTPILFMQLQEEAVEKCSMDIPESTRLKRQRTLAEYKSALQASTSLQEKYPDSIRAIHLFVNFFELASKCAAVTSVEERLKEEVKIEPILEDIEKLMSNSQFGPQNNKRVAFSLTPSLGLLLVAIAFNSRLGKISRKAMYLMKERPFKYGLEDTRYAVAICQAKRQFEEGGRFRNNSTGPEGCQCIPDLSICRSHRTGTLRVTRSDKEATLEIKSIYDTEQGLPGEVMRVLL